MLLRIKENEDVGLKEAFLKQKLLQTKKKTACPTPHLHSFTVQQVYFSLDL